MLLTKIGHLPIKYTTTATTRLPIAEGMPKRSKSKILNHTWANNGEAPPATQISTPLISGYTNAVSKSYIGRALPLDANINCTIFISGVCEKCSSASVSAPTGPLDLAIENSRDFSTPTN